MATVVTNNAPTISGTGVGGLTINEDTPTNITGWRIADVDESGVLTTTLHVSHGTLTLIGSTAGLSSHSGGGTDTITLTGAVMALDSVANTGVTYTPSGNYNGPDQITLIVVDSSGLSTSSAVDVAVIAVNDAPVNTVGGTVAATEDTNLSITGLSVGDVDAGSTSITTTLAVGHGTLTVAGVSGGATVQNSGTATVTLTGTPAQINATLTASNNVIYRGALNFSGNDTLTVTTNDGGNTGSGGALTDIDTKSITVAAANDAPGISGAVVGGMTTNEDTPANITGWRIADVDESGVLTATLHVSHGTVALIGSTAGLSSHSGAGTSTITITGSAAALDSVVNTGVTYTPSGNYNGSDQITLTVVDSLGASTSGAVDITVVAVNDAPNAVDDSLLATAGVPTTISVLSNDTEGDGQSLSVLSATAPAHGTAVVNGNGTITYTPTSGYAGTDSFNYTISDGAGSTDVGTVSVVVGLSNHSIVSGNVFLQGNYMEIGVSSRGSLGTSVAAPTGYHPTNSAISFRVDADGWNTGSAPSSGDFTLPGTPTDSISVGYNGGTTFANDERMSVLGISTVTTDTSSGATLSARTVGTAGGVLTMQQDISLDPAATFFTNTITLTNVGASTLTSVRFMRSFDPDQDSATLGTANTFNDVLANPTVNGAFAIASATGTVSGQAVQLISLDPAARASNFGFSNYNPYASSAYNSPVDANGTSGDIGISLAFDVGSLAVGQSKTVSYFTSMNVAGIADDMITGTTGNNSLSGGIGNDWLFGLNGDDTLTGGSGNDKFVFTPGNGVDIITDFQAGAGSEDVLILDRFSTITNFSEVIAAATNVNNDVTINLGGGAAVTLNAMTIGQLHADDFNFLL